MPKNRTSDKPLLISPGESEFSCLEALQPHDPWTHSAIDQEAKIEVPELLEPQFLDINFVTVNCALESPVPDILSG